MDHRRPSPAVKQHSHHVDFSGRELCRGRKVMKAVSQPSFGMRFSGQGLRKRSGSTEDLRSHASVRSARSGQTRFPTVYPFSPRLEEASSHLLTASWQPSGGRIGQHDAVVAATWLKLLVPNRTTRNNPAGDACLKPQLRSSVGRVLSSLGAQPAQWPVGRVLSRPGAQSAGCGASSSRSSARALLAARCSASFLFRPQAGVKRRPAICAATLKDLA